MEGEGGEGRGWTTNARCSLKPGVRLEIASANKFHIYIYIYILFYLLIRGDCMRIYTPNRNRGSSLPGFRVQGAIEVRSRGLPCKGSAFRDLRHLLVGVIRTTV